MPRNDDLFKAALQDLRYIQKWLYENSLARDSNVTFRETSSHFFIEPSLSSFSENQIPAGYRKELYEKNDYVRDYLYDLLRRNFTFLMIDHTIIQCLYTFEGPQLIKQTMTFNPSPFHKNYDGNIEEYEVPEGMLENRYEELPPLTILRFDYSPDDFKESTHSKTHMHLGIKNESRICVKSPLTIVNYFSFIIKHFYHGQFAGFRSFIQSQGRSCFKEPTYEITIADSEKQEMHIHFE